MTMKAFVEAFVWLWGGTKKNARETYRNADENYKRLIIHCYETQNRLAFWND